MILITGATGHIGSELIAALLPAQAGHIRVLTRNPDAVFPDGTQTVVADLGDSDLAPVLDGVHAVFLLTDGLNIAAHDHRLIDAAQQAGVERIVKLSVRSVGHGATDPITTWHRAGEEAIRDSGIGWTFLRPTALMSNALNWAPMIAADQVVHAPFAAGRAAVVDPADIAAVAAASLTQDGHNHRVYELTGPEPLSPTDQVAILSQVLDRDLRYAETDPADTTRADGVLRHARRAGARHHRDVPLHPEAVQLRADRRHHHSHEPPGTQLHRLGPGPPHRAPHARQLVKVMPATAC